jgi:hypothetical protein
MFETGAGEYEPSHGWAEEEGADLISLVGREDVCAQCYHCLAVSDAGAA